MKNFFITLGKSIFGPEFYRSLDDKPFSYSMGYYLKLALFMSVIAAVAVTLVAVPLIKTGLVAFADDVQAVFPADLVITVKNHQASTNQPEPYKIPLPANASEKYGDVSKLKNLLVIDTKHTYTNDQFFAAQTIFLMTKDSVITQKNSGAIEIIPLTDAPDVTVDRAFFESGVGKAVGFFQKISYFVAPLVFVLGLLYFLVVRLFYLLIFALIIWLARNAFHLPGGYAKAYQTGLHAMTLPMLLFLPLHLFTGYFTLWYSLALLVVVLVNLGNTSKTPITLP